MIFDDHDNEYNEDKDRNHDDDFVLDAMLLVLAIFTMFFDDHDNDYNDDKDRKHDDFVFDAMLL